MADFLQYGAQYYRAPTPDKSKWEQDLSQMAENGFNTIKIWGQWRWNQPAENEYYFDDLDCLMDLAHKYGLKVVINTIFDVAPAWFYQKYPDSVMITSDGRRVEPRSTMWRQIGGAPGPCFHHPEADLVKSEFLAKLVERYSNHPAMHMWDLWNEPELTCGILRDATQEDMICYCPNCEKRFKEWLAVKYGTIHKLNEIWGRNYKSFHEAELPRTKETFADMIDWRQFFSHKLTKELENRIKITKQYDKTHPVMVHSVHFFNAVNGGANDHEIAKLVDVFGNSAMNNPYDSILSYSCAPDKLIISAEIHAIGGDTYGRPKIPTFEDLKSYILVPLSAGLKGFLYWQYHAETLGREAPAWGLTRLNGTFPEWYGYASRIGKVLLENKEVILNSKRQPSEVAVVYGFDNELFDWCASSGNKTWYIDSVKGLFRAVYDANYNVDIISYGHLSKEQLKQYKVIILPFPYVVKSEAANLLEDWVKEGGTLISEGFFGSVNGETFRHQEEVPGYSFEKIFGTKESLVHTSSVFENAYLSQWSKTKEKNDIPILLEQEEILSGYYFTEVLEPETAKVIGHFYGDKPAITENKYHKGKAILIGSLIGINYFKHNRADVYHFLDSLIRKTGVKRTATVEDRTVRIDVLSEKEHAMLIISNRSEEPKDLFFEINHPGLTGKTKATDAFTGKDYVLKNNKMHCQVDSNSYNLYIII